MKWSNVKDFIFSRLPGYFREYDTYKDSEGKGILERFIEVCSEYFDEEVISEIDNLSYLQDIDKTSPIFLNYLWEFLGYIPYAYGVITTGESYSKENLDKWLKQSLRGNLPVDTRRLLKYAISLYKIRCTKGFYDILGRFYGINFLVYDPNANIHPNQSGIGISSTSVWDTTYDSSRSYDVQNTNYDSIGKCWECSKIRIVVQIPKATYDTIISKGDFENTKKMIVEIVNKYLPIQVKLLTVENDVSEPLLVSTYGSNFDSSKYENIEGGYRFKSIQFVII